MFRGECDWKALHRLDQLSRFGKAWSVSPWRRNSLRVSRLVEGRPRRGQEELPVVRRLLHGLGVQSTPLVPDIVQVAVAVDPLGQGGGLSVLAGPGDEVEKAAEGKAGRGEE